MKPEFKWQAENLNNKAFNAAVREITDPAEMLQCLCENWDFLGRDPYYREIGDVLYDQANIVSADAKHRRKLKNG